MSHATLVALADRRALIGRRAGWHRPATVWWDLERDRLGRLYAQAAVGADDQAPFIDLVDDVFVFVLVLVLDVDLETLHRRLDQRPQGGWGSTPSERDLVVRLHRTRDDIPETGTVIEATTRPCPRSRHLTSPTVPRVWTPSR